MFRITRWPGIALILCAATVSLFPPAIVSAGGAYPATMAWSPDGQYIVSTPYGARGPRIFNRKGQQVRYVKYEALAWNATWSPDSHHLAFLTNEPALRLMDVETEESEILLGQNFGAAKIHWSPDGAWIAINENGSRGGVYLIPVDSGDVERVGVEKSYFVGWSPDGAHFLLWQNDVLYVGATGDTTLTPLHDEAFKAHVFAEWSIDGRQIAMTLIDAETEVLDIFTVDVDGENLERITTGRNAFAVGWSAEDVGIIYVTTNDRVQDLWVTELASGDVRNLTGTGTFGFKTVYLTHDRSFAVFYRVGLQVLRLEDGETREIDGGTFAMAPDSNVLAVQHPAKNDILHIVSLDALWETPAVIP